MLKEQLLLSIEDGFQHNLKISDQDLMMSIKENLSKSRESSEQVKISMITKYQTTQTTTNGTIFRLKTSAYSGNYLTSMNKSTTTSNR